LMTKIFGFTSTRSQPITNWAWIKKQPLSARAPRPPSTSFTLSVEWVGETTFKFYCQSRGNPDRLLIDTRSIEALKDFSELHIGVQCYRNEDPLVGQCSRLTIGSERKRNLDTVLQGKFNRYAVKGGWSMGRVC